VRASAQRGSRQKQEFRNYAFSLACRDMTLPLLLIGLGAPNSLYKKGIDDDTQLKKGVCIHQNYDFPPYRDGLRSFGFAVK
jgi:hypothetical protein